MFISNVKLNKRHLERFKTFSVILLLILYFAGNVQVETFHQFFHSLEKALHSAEQEKDPCHRAIYHEAKNEGCDHKTHVTAVKKCPLCHVLPLNEQNISAGRSFESIPLLPLGNKHFLSFQVAEAFLALPSRAPPAQL